MVEAQLTLPVAPTLRETLLALGYTVRAPVRRPQRYREIVDAAGEVAFTGDAGEVWAWIEAGCPR